MDLEVLNEIEISLISKQKEIKALKSEYSNIKILNEILLFSKNHPVGTHYFVPVHIKCIIEALGWKVVELSDNSEITYSIAQISDGCDRCRSLKSFKYSLDYIICEGPEFLARTKHINEYGDVEIVLSECERKPYIRYIDSSDIEHKVNYGLLLKTTLNRRKLDYDYNVDHTRKMADGFSSIVGVHFSEAFLVVKT